MTSSKIIMHVDFQQREILINIFNSITHYYELGLHPGSMVEHVLCGRPDEARRSLHPVIKEHEIQNNYDFIAMLQRRIERVMISDAWGSQKKFNAWCHHEGLNKATPATFLMAKLFDDGQTIDQVENNEV